jgi:peptidoglycan/LPS O-acetylase OafA/YrhL
MTEKMVSRVSWVDSLRGLSALVVMVLHFFHITLVALYAQLSGQPLDRAQHKVLENTLTLYRQLPIDVTPYLWPADGIFTFWDAGKVGVLVFFLISGFVIPMSLGGKAVQPLKRFVVSRFFRLYPVYWFSLLVLLVVHLSFHFKVPGWPQILLNFTMFQKFFFQPDLNGVAWTLQIELIFYGLCALLFYWRRLTEFKAIACMIGLNLLLGLAMALVNFKLGKSLPLALPLGLTYMWFGYLSRAFFADSSFSSRSALTVIAVSLPLVCLICWLGYHEDGLRYVITYLSAPLIFALGRFAFNRHQAILFFLGQISYSVYLLHTLVGVVVINGLINAFSTAWFIQHPEMVFLPALLAMGMTILVSYITYSSIEKPCIKLGKQMITQRGY